MSYLDKKVSLTYGLISALVMAPAYPVEMGNIPERKCGTPEPSMSERLIKEERLNNARLATSIRFPPPNQPVTIPVRFHVIYKMDSGNAVGNVSDVAINRQINVLNNAYQGSGFKFVLSSVDRTENTVWFDNCMDDIYKSPFKKALAIDPMHNLNVYSCGSGYLLGIATFPDMFEQGDYRHGIVVNYISLPGGQAPYNQGDTAVHEVGHYLGLYHTFGYISSPTEGCAVDWDLVDDTAIERTSASGCPVQRDTCQGRLGKDPVSNYMDYSSDVCMTNFSLGQIRRMQRQVEVFKTGLLSGGS